MSKWVDAICECCGEVWRKPAGYYSRPRNCDWCRMRCAANVPHTERR
jgi:hypothetical protein